MLIVRTRFTKKSDSYSAGLRIPSLLSLLQLQLSVRVLHDPGSHGSGLDWIGLDETATHDALTQITSNWFQAAWFGFPSPPLLAHTAHELWL